MGPVRNQFQFHHLIFSSSVPIVFYISHMQPTSPHCFQVSISGNLCANTPPGYRHAYRLILEVVPPRLQNGLMKMK